MSALHNVILSYDTFEYDRQLVNEARELGQPIVLKGILQRAETLNQNGRIYPLPILQREVRNYQKLINERRAMGELDHPESSVIELKNVSHIVTSMYFKGNDVYGSIELLDTPAGKIAQSLVANNVTFGISSRGVGSTKKMGDTYTVQEDFVLVCLDLVSEPSTPGAFMLKEGKLSNDQLKQYFTSGDRIDRIVNDIIAWT